MAIESRAKWTDLIPDVGLKISEVYDQANELYTPGIFGVLIKKAGDGAQKNYTGKTGFTEVQEFEDGDDVPEVRREKTYTTKVVYRNYGGSVNVTKNTIEDRDFESELDEMKDLSLSCNYSSDKSGVQLFNGGFSTTTSVNGYSVAWYGDGVPQFSTVHPTPVTGFSTQSNASSTGIQLSHDNYNVGRLALQLQQTDNAQAMMLAGKLMLVTPLNLEKTATETLNSVLTPETGNNALNFFRGTTDLMTTAYLDSVNGGSNTAWFVLNPTRHKLTQEVRQEKRLENDVNILNKVVTFTVDARWINHSREWKGTWGSKGDLATYSS